MPLLRFVVPIYASWKLRLRLCHSFLISSNYVPIFIFARNASCRSTVIRDRLDTFGQHSKHSSDKQRDRSVLRNRSSNECRIERNGYRYEYQEMRKPRLRRSIEHRDDRPLLDSTLSGFVCKRNSRGTDKRRENAQRARSTYDPLVIKTDRQ